MNPVPADRPAGRQTTDVPSARSMAGSRPYERGNGTNGDVLSHEGDAV